MKTIVTTFVILIFALLIHFSAVAQTVSPEEKKIIDYIDQQNAEAIKFLESIVNIESRTEDTAGVN